MLTGCSGSDPNPGTSPNSRTSAICGSNSGTCYTTSPGTRCEYHASNADHAEYCALIAIADFFVG